MKRGHRRGPARKRVTHTQEIHLRHSTALQITATVDVFTGKPLVEIHHPDAPFTADVDLTPTEARTIAPALERYATQADAKRNK